MEPISESLALEIAKIEAGGNMAFTGVALIEGTNCYAITQTTANGSRPRGGPWKVITPTRKVLEFSSLHGGDRPEIAIKVLAERFGAGGSGSSEGVNEEVRRRSTEFFKDLLSKRGLEEEPPSLP